ncbi:hypothetical protein [Streptomyces sp. KL118A]|uniref:hypothetical protein n=1 Tax=Streptomyces sp. KL118A TaxID=3045153 RepID=UPI00278C7440|nr:hypothetical protein [Streptomyces sp. KL118A]
MKHLKHVSALSGATALLVLSTVPAAAAPTPPTPDAPRPTLTAKASVSSVRVAEEFRITGESHDMPTGTRVTLQQKQGAQWVSLPASVNTTPRGTYSMRVVLGLEGRNALRMTGGEAVSPVVQVTVLP